MSNCHVSTRTSHLSRIASMVWAAVLLNIGLTIQVAGQSGSKLFLIDFESYEEGTEISTQYAHLGAVFSIDGIQDAWPIIAVEGGATVAFQGSGPDSPMSSGVAGLTDPLVGGDFAVGRDIAIDFSPPVTSVRLFVIDIDGTEKVTLRAYDGETEVASIMRAGGQTGTGDGVSTEFFLSEENITRVVIDVSDQIGFAVDFLTFTRPCIDDECGSRIEVSQESAPGASDFADHILGFILPYPTTTEASRFYAYDVPEGDSWNGQSLTPIIDRSHLLLADTSEGVTLVIVHDRAIPDDPDGGRAEMRFQLVNDPDGAFVSVQDDPPSNETGSGYTTDVEGKVFTTGHAWSPCCTDGVAISGLEGPWIMFVEFAEIDGDGATAPIVGLTEWFAYSGDGTQIPLVLETNRRVRLRSIEVSLPGDLDDDGFINFVDYALFAGHWLEESCIEPELCGGADLVPSGTVDLFDLADFAGKWLTGY